MHLHVKAIGDLRIIELGIGRSDGCLQGGNEHLLLHLLHWLVEGGAGEEGEEREDGGGREGKEGECGGDDTGGWRMEEKREREIRSMAKQKLCASPTRQAGAMPPISIYLQLRENRNHRYEPRHMSVNQQHISRNQHYTQKETLCTEKNTMHRKKHEEAVSIHDRHVRRVKSLQHNGFTTNILYIYNKQNKENSLTIYH